MSDSLSEARPPAYETSPARETSLFDDLEYRMQFAPVCRLEDGALAGAELQLLGPAGTSVGTAAALRRAARMMEQQGSIDRRKRDFAGSDTARSIAKVLPLLVSVDLDLVDDIDQAVVDSLEQHVTVVLPEMLERSPQNVLGRVNKARAAGRVICVDGLASSRQAATLLSLVEPDIIMTSAELLRREPDSDAAQLAHIIAAHTERTHAVVIADGVDTEQQRRTAQTLGAAFGIGRLYPPVADPSRLATKAIVPLPDLPVWSTPQSGFDTPFAIASQSTTPRRGTKRLLIEMSKELERQATNGGAGVVLGTFQHAHNFTSTTATRWREMSEITGLAGVYGVGLVDVRDGNVHRAPLSPDDDLVNEWNVVVLGPHFAGLLSARDQHSGAADLERTFDFVLTYDRLAVTQAVHSILSRFC